MKILKTGTKNKIKKQILYKKKKKNKNRRFSIMKEYFWSTVDINLPQLKSS